MSETRDTRAQPTGVFHGVDELCMNSIRMLSIDAVQKANSGHPGMPMDVLPQHTSAPSIQR